VGYFFIGKQKVVLFHKYRENSWESAASALTCVSQKQPELSIFRCLLLFLISRSLLWVWVLKKKWI
jgi:hypothetical protein